MKKWYAVQVNALDYWDYGSYDFDEAVEMLKEQCEGLIAVIDEDTNYCIEEIWLEEIE